MRTLVDHPLYQLVLTRFREFWREPGAVFWVFAFPILIAVALGIAFRNQGPTNVAVAVVDGPQAKAAQAAIAAQPGLEATIMTEADSRRALQTARVGAVVMHEPLRILSDDTQENTRLVVATVRDALERGGGRADTLTIGHEKVESVGTRYIDFLLPGVLGMSIMSSSIWGVGWSLVQLRTRKLLKRLAATPMKKRDLLMSFVVYRLLLAILESAVLILFGILVFNLTVRGSYAGVALGLMLGMLSFSGIALLVASRAQNAETASGLMNLVTMPMFLLSGVFFSSDRFPSWMQPFVKVLPLTALNDFLRAIINEGASVASQAGSFGVMAVWTVLSFVIALRIFRWT